MVIEDVSLKYIKLSTCIDHFCDSLIFQAIFQVSSHAIALCIMKLKFIDRKSSTDGQVAMQQKKHLFFHIVMHIRNRKKNTIYGRDLDLSFGC